MNILFLHPNFPAQYFYLCQHMASSLKNKVIYITKDTNNFVFPGVQTILYQPSRPPCKETHHYARPLEEAVLDGQAVYRKVAELRQSGFVPDVIIGHTGWGSTLYMKDLYPKVPLIGYFEWYYHAHGSDVQYWEDEQVDADEALRIKTRNAHHLLNLVNCDARYCPTEWQRQQFPPEFAAAMQVLHEGIDTEFCRPAAGVKLILDDIKLDLSEEEEIITYVSRGFEPYRGFPQFMDALRLVLSHRPKCHVVLVGVDRNCYGRPPAPNKTYQQVEMEKGGLDMSRVHFVGLRTRRDYLRILQASSVHVYLTRPFILSWSMLEAMSAGCALVASATPPVEEVVEDNVNGLLVNFRSPEHIAQRIEEALTDKALRHRLSSKARETILERYELNKLLRNQVNMIYAQLK